jgi:hypothetical protein
VPSTIPAWVDVLGAATARASPKSTTLTVPSVETSTFSGLTSRCTRPARCAAASAASTGSSTETASSGRSRPRRRSTSRSVLPATSSITRNTTQPARVSSAPWSKTATALGCDSRAAVRASRTKRSVNAGSCASAGAITLTATRRSSRRSVPAYTVDMPPRAIGASTR